MALPARRRSGRDNRPGVAGPARRHSRPHPRARVEPVRRRSRAVPRMLRPQRPGLVADRLLRARAALGRSSAAAAQLKFGFRRAPATSCATRHHADETRDTPGRTTVTLPTKPSRCRRNSDNRSAFSTKPSSAGSATVGQHTRCRRQTAVQVPRRCSVAFQRPLRLAGWCCGVKV